MTLPRITFRVSAFAVLALALAGCSSTAPMAISPERAIAGTLVGRTMGGQQPVNAATIRLYAINPTTDGGASTNLLNKIITTSDGTGLVNSNANTGNANNTLPAGYFNITPGTDYACPSAATQVYLASLGGNPGISQATNNTAIQQLVALGQCGDLATRQFVVVNEVTTVAFAASFYPYADRVTSVGAASASGFAAALNIFNEYVDSNTGQSPGPALPTGYDADTLELNSLANSIASCVNTTSYMDGNCDILFGYATPPANAVLNPGVKPRDVFNALLDIRRNPTNNVANIYNRSAAVVAFYPFSSTAPTDWTLPIRSITPTFSPAGGSYSTAQTVTIADAESGASIYYTTDGTTPTTLSSLYTGPVFVNAALTLKAVAVSSSGIASAVGSATYTGTLTQSTPTVSLSAITTPYRSTGGLTLTAYSTADGSVVRFGKGAGVDGSFSNATCTIASGTCSVTYVPSGSLAADTYTAGLTASFNPIGSYAPAAASSTLSVTASYDFTVLHSIGYDDGELPLGSLVQGSDGFFYGMCRQGGDNSLGSIFRVDAAGTTFTVLYSFAAADGSYPEGSLVQGSDGFFYGLTSAYGANGYGTIFKFVAAGSTLTVLHSFTAAEGESPYGSLVRGSDGFFYGLTYAGGDYGYGTMFKIDAAGANLTVLRSFAPADGYAPHGSLVQGSDGLFYGLTTHGGTNGLGTVFKVNAAGANYTVLHAFAPGEGQSPQGTLVQGSDGFFYGQTQGDITYIRGAVFKIDATGSTFTVLHTLRDDDDGRASYGALVQGSDGSFYGMTRRGGTYDNGIIFRINAAASTYTILRSLANVEGRHPQGALVQGPDGALYGLASQGGAENPGGGTPDRGTVFRFALSPALPPPIPLAVPSSVTRGASFNLAYSVSNAYSTTLQRCQYFDRDSSGTVVGTGALTGRVNTQNTSLIAPAAPGTYSLALTCGGVETGFATLNVQ